MDSIEDKIRDGSSSQLGTPRPRSAREYKSWYDHRMTILASQGIRPIIDDILIKLVLLCQGRAVLHAAVYALHGIQVLLLVLQDV